MSVQKEMERDILDLKNIAPTADVMVVGSCNVDFFTFTERLPLPGETITGVGAHVDFGGKGANQAVMASELGVSVGMVAKVGFDTFGNDYIRNLESHGISRRYISRAEAGIPTGVAQICVSNDGNNTIVIVAGANGKLSEDDVTTALDNLLAPPKVIVCQLEVPQETTLCALKKGRSLGATTILNPAPAAKLIPDMLESADILCLNETELEVLCESIDGGKHMDVKELEEVERAAKFLISKGAHDIVVTLGSRGCLYVPTKGGDTKIFSADTSVPAVDTTGAGDAFIGTLAAKLSLGMPVAKGVETAVRVASLACRMRGVQPSFAAVAKALKEEDKA